MLEEKRATIEGAQLGFGVSAIAVCLFTKSPDVGLALAVIAVSLMALKYTVFRKRVPTPTQGGGNQ